MNKPYIVCHMMMSVDGRIDCPMTEKLGGVEEYYNTLDSYKTNAHVSGKTTAKLEMAAKGSFTSSNDKKANKELVFNNGKKVECYEIVVDTKGTLLWNDNYDGSLLIILSEDVNLDYLNYLKERDISYIVTGKDKIDLNRACEILFNDFNVTRMAVVGGGHINAGFLKAGLIDEVSILIGAGIDGREEMASVFDGFSLDYPLTNLKLKDVQKFDSDAVWIKYIVKK